MTRSIYPRRGRPTSCVRSGKEWEANNSRSIEVPSLPMRCGKLDSLCHPQSGQVISIFSGADLEFAVSEQVNDCVIGE